MRHAVATVILASLILLGWWCSADRRPAPRAENTVDDGANGVVLLPAEEPEDAGDERAPPAGTNQEPARPASLSGTDVDGSLTLINGRFVPDRHALRLFDYFLSTEGEVSLERIREMVEEAVRARVPEDQIDSVMTLFDEYLRYRRESGKLAERSSADSYFEELKALQEEIFGDDARQLFGRENRMAEYAIARKAIATDSSLSVTERNAKLAELQASLPEPLRELRAPMVHHAEVSKVVDQMRRDGLSEEEIFEYRADEFGEVAAGRLAELDAKRGAWSEKLDEYRVQRDLIWAQDLEPQQEEDALEQLRKEHFEGTEIVRVRALDKQDRTQER